MSNPKCLDQSHLDIQFKNKYFFQLLNSSLLNLCIIDDIISRATHKQNSSELIISIVKFIDIFRWQSLTSAQECKEILNFPVTVINSWKQKINSSPFAKCLPQICNYSMLLFFSGRPCLAWAQNTRWVQCGHWSQGEVYRIWESPCCWWWWEGKKTIFLNLFTSLHKLLYTKPLFYICVYQFVYRYYYT